MNCVKLFGVSEIWVFVTCDNFNVKFFFINFSKILIFFPCFLKIVDNSTGIVVALKSPTKRIFGRLEKGNSSSTLLGNMIIHIFTIHILLGKVASFVFKNLTIERKYFWKEADISLLLKLICWVSIYKHSFSGCVSM